MYKNLVLKEIAEHKWKLIIGTIILIILGVTIPITFDYMHDILPHLEELPLAIGTGIAKEINLYLSDYDIYVWAQWNGKNLTQIGTIISLLLGATAIASEVSRGTIAYLLTKPTSKTKILTTKIIVSVSFIFIFTLISTLAMLIASILANKGYFGSIVFLGIVPVFVGMIASYFIALFFSILCDDSIKAFAYSAGLLILNSVFGFFSSTQKLSLSYHAKGIDYVINGNLPILSIIILAIVSIIFGFLSYKKFIKKEY
ncbi:ABC transporter permease subunit [Alkalicella caledoniensis]|uniref:ABC transporter permease subunit n=1 Tax=Alkalicella caledoniensis TaxID=2731377 RepID=A0A7G9W831_ALKCA|nr:ABC transporter permease subunit [Alkalicella caledoniensis]QNO14843.1 ABC transporter permease subunit [Alkalicella caledoniensis]